MSVVWLKPDYNTKISELEKKLTDHNHDKYITTLEFNTLAAGVFDARLALANLITKTDFDTKVSSLDSKIAANISKNDSIEDNLGKLGKSFFLIFSGNMIFDGGDGFPAYFNQYTDILKLLLTLNTFLNGNLKDCLMKVLSLLLLLIIVLLH